MSANGLWKSRYENEEGYGDTLYFWGELRLVDGKVYVNGEPLEKYLEEYDGKVVACEFVFGLKRFEGYKPSEKVKGLVEGLQK